MREKVPETPAPPTFAPLPLPTPPAPGETKPAGAPEETVQVRPAASSGAAPAESPPEDDQKNPIQILLESVAILVFLVLAIIPVARLGFLEVPGRDQRNILIAAGFLLGILVLLFPRAKYRQRTAAFEQQLTRAAHANLALHSLAIAGTIVQILIIVTEIIALLVFLRYIPGTAQAVVTAADNFTLFSTFSLLLVDMLLIARTSFPSKYRGKNWHPMVAYVLFAVSALLFLAALLKNVGILNIGALRGVRPEQSSYILVLGVLCQLIGTKMFLLYPPVGRIVLGELEAAKRADREFRDVLRHKATKAYVVGFAYILISIFVLGGVATGQVATGEARTANFLIVTYVTFGAILLGLLFTRYMQQRFLQERERRRVAGEPIAKKRLSRDQINQILLFSFSAFFALLFIVLAILTFMGRLPIRTRWGTDFLLMAFLIGVGPYGFHRAVRIRRTRAVDDKFPEFLRDLAEGQRAGMTLPKALLTASKGVYGALTPEIKRMNAQVEWGVNFTEALQRFSDRVKTPLIGRTVALIVEASRAGGSVVDILTAASTDAQEIKQILEERRRQMGIYSVIIYVAFFVFLSVIFILANQFLPSFESAVQGAQGQQVAGFKFGAFETETYVNVFFHAALIQGIGGGLVAGMMTEGHPLGGLKHAVTMSIISWIFFRVFVG